MSTTTLQPTRMSLFDVEAGWIPLIEARAEAEEIIDTAEREAAIAAADVALAEHAERELSKVDSYIGICKFLQFTVDAADQEYRRQKMRKAVAERLLAQLKATAICAIEASGKPRLNGTRGYLSVKKNGSVQPLVIENESLLPDDCCRMEGWISADLWYDFEVWVRAGYRAGYLDSNCSLKRVPNNAAIRSKLLEDCPSCGGHPELVVPILPGEPDGCSACGGTGKNAVPGAYLGERGKHLEVR